MLLALLKLLRPHQWIKNSFVLAGIIFANAWDSDILLCKAILAAFAFSLISSATYIFNDVCDKQADSIHPIKKSRPIAANIISIEFALILASLLMMLSLIIGFSISIILGEILLTYLILNLAYSIYLKHIILLDVLAITSGFLLRVLAGTTGIGIHPSFWLLICTFTLTLCLALNKRRSELLLQAKEDKKFFPEQKYNPQLLNNFVILTAGLSALFYASYAIDQTYIIKSHVHKITYTIPLVFYGIYRYIHLSFRASNQYTGLDIAKDIFMDKPLLVVSLLWMVLVWI